MITTPKIIVDILRCLKQKNNNTIPSTGALKAALARPVSTPTALNIRHSGAAPSYLTVTEVYELGLLPAGPDQFALEQLAVEVHPGAAVLPRDWLTAGVVGEQRHVHARHEQSTQLHAAGVQAVYLEKK